MTNNEKHYSINRCRNTNKMTICK